MIPTQERYNKLWKRVCEQMEEKNGVCKLYSMYYARKSGKTFRITWTTTIEAVSDFITEMVHGNRYLDLVWLKDPTITRQKKQEALKTCFDDFNVDFNRAMDNLFIYHLAKTFFRYDNVEFKQQ